MTPSDGASCGARGRRLVTVAPRAASGINQSGTTTGRGGASLDWDWWARVTPVEEREASAPRLGRPYRAGRPASSQEAWPEAGASGDESPLGQSRGGTPTGELPPPVSSPAMGSPSRWRDGVPLGGG